MSHPRSPCLIAAPLAAAGVVLALGACGGSAPNSAAATSQEREQTLVKFAKCMREHGVNVTTPAGASGAIKFNGAGASPQTLEAAQNACRRFQPTAPTENLTPAERAQRVDGAQKFARCMRTHGIDVPDPSVGAKGQVGIQLRNVNPQNPSFQAAQSACQGLLPKPPGGADKRSTGPGGPGGANGGYGLAGPGAATSTGG
jgi:hypothetical protein